MATNFLREMESDLVNYAGVISFLLDIEVKVYDKELKKIVDIGKQFNDIDYNLGCGKKIYHEVLNNGESKIIENPGLQSVCEKCSQAKKCTLSISLYLPIKINNTVYGVIRLNSFSDALKRKIINNINNYFESLENILDQLEQKINGDINRDGLSSDFDNLSNIADNIDRGVIIYDENGNIKINQSAKNMLDFQDNELHNINLESTGNFVVDQDEYYLSIGNKTFTVIGKHLKNSYLGSVEIFAFTEIEKVRDEVLTATSSKSNLQLENILGSSRIMNVLKDKIKKFASSSSTVLITGESGTGKEIFARVIHSESDRKDRSFVGINCAAIPESLLESELFGYIKGAFTGADPKGKMGLIELANNGTLFLDEIADMPLYLQSKLLRVVERKEVIRLGSNITTNVNVRIIAATNQDLETLIKEKRFRDDLYYRLNVIPVNIPPLRQRKDDIRVLVENFTGKYAALLNKKVLGFDNSVWEYLENYDWPGNVRELENAIEYAINIMDEKGVVTPKHLLPKLLEDDSNSEEVITLEQMERQHINNALNTYGRNTAGKQKTAMVLGIGIATLYRKMKKYDL